MFNSLSAVLELMFVSSLGLKVFVFLMSLLRPNLSYWSVLLLLRLPRLLDLLLTGLLLCDRLPLLPDGLLELLGLLCELLVRLLNLSQLAPRPPLLPLLRLLGSEVNTS